MKPFLSLWLVLLSSTALAQATPHRHGVGQLDVVVDAARLEVVLQVPQHDLVGFERAPRGAREQVTVQATLEKLGDPDRLFEFSPAARCRLLEKTLDAPLLTGAGGAVEGHADVQARYVYRCEQPAALRDLRVEAFETFRRLHRLDIGLVGPRGQRAGTVSPRQPVFAW